MLFNNAQACMSWLTYLQKECGAEDLLGKNLTTVAQQVWLYNCAGDMLNFYAEIPLLGPVTMDISCQYLVSLFAKGNAFGRHALEEQGKLFTDYAQKMLAIAGVQAKSRSMFLEADTSKEQQKQLSVFYNMENAYYQKLLPVILQGEGYPDMTDRVQEVLQLLQPHAALWQLGCMHGREQRPLRLVLSLARGHLGKALELLALPGREQITEQVACLSALDTFVEDILDLDIFPDGSVGPVVGVELALKHLYPAQQMALFKQPEYANFKQLLQSLGLADERIHKVERCALAMQAPDRWQYPYYIYSGVSHFKLQWHSGEALPVKVYVRLMPVQLKTTINDSLQVFSRES